MQVGVVGSKKVNSKETWNEAFKVGQEIACASGILVCGGLSGVMEASAKGAKEAGG